MLEVKSKETSKSKAALLDLVFIALFAAVMTVCAQIQIPFGEVPFTLQTLGVFIAASLLGWKRGHSAYSFMYFSVLSVFLCLQVSAEV